MICNNNNINENLLVYNDNDDNNNNIKHIDNYKQIKKNLDLALQDDADVTFNDYFSLLSIFDDETINDDDNNNNNDVNEPINTFTNDDNSNNSLKKRVNNNNNDNNWIKSKLIIADYTFLIAYTSDIAFGFAGDDTTGNVLWGSSICLAHYILSTLDLSLFIDSNNNESSSSSASSALRILELGCGSCALPSLAITKVLTTNNNNSLQSTIISTDFNVDALNCVQYNQYINGFNNDDLINDNVSSTINITATSNTCNTVNLYKPTLHVEVQKLDWLNPQLYYQNNNKEPIDIILAADIIYGISFIPAIVRTIQYLFQYNDTTIIKDKNQLLLIATKDGRRGINEFHLLMKQQVSELKLINKIHMTSDQLKECIDITTIIDNVNDDRNNDCDNTHNERWLGTYTIYVYKKSQNNYVIM